MPAHGPRGSGPPCLVLRVHRRSLRRQLLEGADFAGRTHCAGVRRDFPPTWEPPGGLGWSVTLPDASKGQGVRGSWGRPRRQGRGRGARGVLPTFGRGGIVFSRPACSASLTPSPRGLGRAGPPGQRAQQRVPCVPESGWGAGVRSAAPPAPVRSPAALGLTVSSRCPGPAGLPGPGCS